MVDEIPSFGIKVVMVDLNAKLSGDRRGIPSSIGPHGSADNINDNGDRLLSLCSTIGLSIGNTFFKHKRIHKNTWISPDGNTSDDIDYYVNNIYRSSLQYVRACGGADVGSDHSLVIGKIHLKLKKATKPEVSKTYSTEKLKEQTASENFRIETRDTFAALEHSTDLEEQWQTCVSGVTYSAAKILGKRRGTNKERWISCETCDLIDARKRTKNTRDQTKCSQGWNTSDTKYRRRTKK